MPTASEAGGKQRQMQAVLDEGLQQLSSDETVTFQRYNRAVVSDDGSVFWVATGQTKAVRGSLHIAVDRMQDQDQTIGATTAIFTAEGLVTEFNAIAPGTMWIGAWEVSGGVTLQVAFSQRGRFYEESKLWHYSGYTIFPAMQSQIIDSIDDMPTGPIVSNSLPIWLSQTTVGAMTVSVYPSFLVPENIVPPYIVAHVEPSGTVALGNFPVFTNTTVPVGGGAAPFYEFASAQLCRDEVDLILYGFTNDMAIQYYAGLIDFSMVGPGEPPTFGFANSPAIRDEKRTQVEIAALAQKKSLHISANYYQSTANAIAYRLILSASMTLVIA